MDFNLMASKKRKKSSCELLQVKDYAQDRIIHQMFRKISANATISPDYIVLVLDGHTTHQFGTFGVAFFEMFKYKIFQVEDITRPRKRYPQSDVIYYVSPCMDSVKRIVDDFKDEDEIEYDQYGMVHLAFCATVPDSLMK